MAALLKTKLYVPPVRPELVSRRRLIERLDEGLRRGRRLTLVSAPAGFGKTTLVSEWAHSQGAHRRAPVQEVCAPQVAWLSLDGTDNDPGRFWAYVVAALRSVPNLGESSVGESALSMLQSPQSPPIETLLVDLINDLLEAASQSPAPEGDLRKNAPSAAESGLSQRWVLVLDDLHVITNSQVHDGLAFLLDNLPPSVHVVIATRSDPPLPLSRLRGRGQLTELHAADLRFTPEEATAFLNQAMGLGLSADDVAALEERTEGWIVGLQMAAHALLGADSEGVQDSARVAEFISAFTGSHRYILDYLTDEVLLRESEDVRSFLLQTSILDRLCGPLCDAVTGRDDGQQMLERLDADNLFIVPLDGARQWYRYHGLFAELLRKRLAGLAAMPRAGTSHDRSIQAHDGHSQEAQVLHHRASEWYDGAGYVEEAIRHALASEDMERAAELVEQNAVHQMMHYRREAALAGWLRALPGDLVRSRPWLCICQAWTRYWMGLRDQVEECLQAGEQALRSSVPTVRGGGSLPEGEERLIAGYAAAIRAHHALTNQDIPRVIEMAHRAIELLPAGDYMRCEAAVALGGAHWAQGDVVASQRAFAQARTTAQEGGHPLMAVPSSCYVGEQQTKRGLLRHAASTYREALEWSTGPHGRPLPVAGFPMIKLGDLACEWNDLESAERDLTRGVELCRQLGQADVMCEAYVALARLSLAQGDVQGVLEALQEMDAVTRQTQIDPWIVTWADECRVRLWISTDDLVSAFRWAREVGLTVDSSLSYQHDLHHVHLARLLLSRYRQQSRTSDVDDALNLLARLSLAAEEAGWVNEQIKILLLQSLALQARGDAQAALVTLSRALELAEPGGYVRTFVDEGAPMARLLHRAAAQGVRPDYAGRLLGAFEFQVADKEDAPVESEQEARLVEPLSEREIEVLCLIAEGLTNREIGQQLYISQGTVKAHTSNIYGKLGVRSRTQAVACAQSLGLLCSG